MRQYRIASGKASLVVTGDLEALARDIVDRTAKAFVDAVAPIADEVAATASSRWYSEVGRKTGKSGQWTTAITLRPDSVSVGVQSLDDRKVGTKGALVAFVVHRAGVLSLRPKYVTQGEWWRAKKAGLPIGRTGTPGSSNWLVYEHNPNAKDGKVLMPELVRKPFRRQVKGIGSRLGPILTDMVRRAVA